MSKALSKQAQHVVLSSVLPELPHPNSFALGSGTALHSESYQATQLTNMNFAGVSGKSSMKLHRFRKGSAACYSLILRKDSHNTTSLAFLSRILPIQTLFLQSHRSKPSHLLAAPAAIPHNVQEKVPCPVSEELPGEVLNLRSNRAHVFAHLH